MVSPVRSRNQPCAICSINTCPSPQADSLVEAEQLLADGDIPGALALFRGAWEDSGQKPEFTMAYAGALITASRLDEAEALLSDIKMVDQDARFQQLMAQIELQRQAARSPEIEALEADLASDEQNHEVRVKLAVQISSQGGIERPWSIFWWYCEPIGTGAMAKLNASIWI